MTPVQGGGAGGLTLRGRWGLLLLLLVIGLTFWGGLSNGFVWDDRLQIVDNPRLDHPAEWSTVFTQFSQSLNFSSSQLTYRPFLPLSFLLDHALWDLDPFGYHLTNLLLHLINVALVAVWSAAVSGSWGIGLLAAALFGLHPVQTETVDWISARTESLAALFILMALIGHVRWIRANRWSAKGWGVVVVLATICGLLSKETALMIPFVVILTERLRPGVLRTPAVWRVLLVSLPVVAYLLLRMATVSAIGQTTTQLGWSHALTTAGLVTANYAALVLWPSGLTATHGLQPVQATPASLLFVTVGVIGVVGLLRWLRKRWPIIEFGLLCAAGFLVPAYALVGMAHPYLLTERNLYLPMAGVALAVSWSVLAVSTSVAPRLGRPGRLIGTGVLLIGIGAMVWATHSRHAIWRDDLALWRDAASHSPASGFAQHNLAVELDHRGRADEAIELLEVYRARHEEELYTTVALAELYVNQGDLLRAKPLFALAIDLAPRRAGSRSSMVARSYFGLGLIAYEQDERAMSVQHLEAAINQNPQHTEAYSHLGILYYERGDFDRAILLYETALSQRPTQRETLYNLAVVLDQSGRTREAIVAYRRYLTSPALSQDGAVESPIESQVRRRLQELNAGPGEDRRKD